MAYEFYPTADFIFINSGAQSRLTAHGFIEIGSDNGHALAFDVVHGTLFRFDPVDPFIEGEDCTDEIQRRYESPVDAEGIRKFALIRYASFPHFCNEALFASKIDRKLKQSGRDDGSALSEEMWRELLRET